MAEELAPLRDLLCWRYLADGCTAPGCALMHLDHDSLPLCGRHVTSAFELWGRRRCVCAGECGKPHPPAETLHARLLRALPEGTRLHTHVRRPPSFDESPAARGGVSYFVVRQSLSEAEAEKLLEAREPVALRVAIDVGYDELMAEGERKSLATQCGLCHSVASDAEHREHVALAICCGTPPPPGKPSPAPSPSRGAGAPPSLALLRAAGIESWRPLAWQRGGTPLSLLSLPAAPPHTLVYLSPDSPHTLSAIDPHAVYVIGGLVDRHKQRAASYARAASLGLRTARLPLPEALPAHLRGVSSSLDALNLHCVLRLLVEWAARGDAAAAAAAALPAAQRHCGGGSAIHPHGYWLGARARSQHQFDRPLAAALLAFFRQEGAASVVDLGCGTGEYVRHFAAHGLAAAGFDGNPATAELSGGLCGVKDLSVAEEAAEAYDWVLSLEVGEHLPPRHEAAFLHNLHAHNRRGVVLSWAVKGQGGVGHVNEQDNAYVEARLRERGYARDAAAEAALRAAARFGYFRRSLMVFRREEARAPPRHAPCWGGWDGADLPLFDAVWRVDFSLHLYASGAVACAILPVCTADGAAVAAAGAAGGVGALLTVAVTTSAVRSHPSTHLLRACLASLDRHGGVAPCRKLLLCDGFKLRRAANLKQGVCTDGEAAAYAAFVGAAVRLVRSHAAFARTRLVRMARRGGSAFAIREAVSGHVATPLVLLVPHDCVLCRDVDLPALAAAMAAAPDGVKYVKLGGQGTASYAEAVRSQHGVVLRPVEIGGGRRLTPMLRYMDNVAMVGVRYLREEVFAAGSGVRRGTFIEDTREGERENPCPPPQEWMRSEAYAKKEAPRNGCFLLSDGVDEPMMRHLDGKSFLDPAQRAAAGLPPYPTAWTPSFPEDECDAQLTDASGGVAAEGIASS
ncbi:hypothetical protein AB1Y20_012806 [Prymnesium parvum]|uniref:tRNA (guanine(9)-N(1))-methyltransferase n=1 Tax=Prymnesium parvum TaxID=97485 RepID=A0AB34IIX3_PRYPA